MPKISIGDVLVFRQLDLLPQRTSKGLQYETRYLSQPLKVKAVRQKGMIRCGVISTWINQPEGLRWASLIASKDINQMLEIVDPIGLSVFCYTPPSSDVSGLKRIMASTLGAMADREANVMHQARDVAFDWGHRVKIPSPELGDTVFVQEE